MMEPNRLEEVHYKAILKRITFFIRNHSSMSLMVLNLNKILFTKATELFY